MRAFAALEEDPDFIPRPHVLAHSYPNSSSRRPGTSLTSVGTRHTRYIYAILAKYVYPPNKITNLKKEGSQGLGRARWFSK